MAKTPFNQNKAARCKIHPHTHTVTHSHTFTHPNPQTFTNIQLKKCAAIKDKSSKPLSGSEIFKTDIKGSYRNDPVPV